MSQDHFNLCSKCWFKCAKIFLWQEPWNLLEKSSWQEAWWSFRLVGVARWIMVLKMKPCYQPLHPRFPRSPFPLLLHQVSI